jgi:hypothetical protein
VHGVSRIAVPIPGTHDFRNPFICRELQATKVRIDGSGKTFLGHHVHSLDFEPSEVVMRSRQLALGLLPALACFFLAACGGTGPATFGGGGGNLSVAVSATNTCQSTRGGASALYNHIYVAVSDVQASPNPNATPGDGSFVDVTPGLSGSPKVIDLLATPNQCSVATLGTGLSLAAGTYQQFRVLLAPDGTTIAGSPCGTFASCVFVSGDTNPHALQIGTEATQGIALGPNQIAGGQFTPSGQAQILNLAFNTCASVVALSSTEFRFKPVIMAGDATGAPSISGQLVDSATSQPVPSGQFLVALEAPDVRLVDRVVAETRPDSSGNFNLCPVMAGTYDVVASGLRTDTGVTYGATATMDVTAGASLGTVPVLAVNAVPASASTVLASTNTAVAAAQPAQADVTITALQAGGPRAITVPLIGGPSSTLNLATQPSASCPSGTDCADFQLSLPAASPVLGEFSPSGTSYIPSAGTASFQVEGTTFAPLSGASPFCSPTFSGLNTGLLTPGGVLDLTPTPLSFTGCQ